MASVTIEGHGGPKDSLTNMDFGTRTHGDTTPHTRDVLITNDGNKKLDWTVTVTSRVQLAIV